MARKAGVNLTHVALKSGVSTTTASMVLSDRWQEFRIAPATRDQVLAAADELGYVAKRSKAKASQRSRLWTIFAPLDFDAGPTSEFFRGVYTYVEDEGLGVETVVFPFERDRLRDKASWMRPDFSSGAIMIGLSDEDLAFVESEDFGIPIVLVNRVAKNWPSVVTDDYEVGNRVMRHFDERGLTQVAMIMPDYTTRSQSLRAVGFQDTLRELRRAAGGDTSAEIPQARAVNDYAGGRRAVEELIPHLTPSTGVFVLYDHMVGGVIHGLQEHGFTVPGDIEVVSYGNSAVNALMRPTVTSVAAPIAQMSRDCARALHQASTVASDMGSFSRLHDVEIIFRESSPETSP